MCVCVLVMCVFGLYKCVGVCVECVCDFFCEVCV